MPNAPTRTHAGLMTASCTAHSPAPISAREPSTGLGRRVAVALIAVVAMPGVLIALLAATGPTMLFVVVLYPFMLWALVRQMRRPLDSVRVLLALLVAVMCGVGVGIGMLLVGIATGFVPFLSDGQYPHADAWGLLSGAVGFGTAVVVLGLGLVGRRD